MKKNSNLLYTIILYFLSFPKFLDKVKKIKNAKKMRENCKKYFFMEET
jgi:hypothetical protein